MDFFNFVKNNKFTFLFASILFNIIFIGLVIYFAYKSSLNTTCNINGTMGNTINQETTNEEYSYYVEIKGAVKKPGVYKVEDGLIINDLITLAGGLTKNAYIKNINLSKRLVPEVVIYIFTESEYKQKLEKLNKKEIEKIYIEVDSPCECSNYEITNCTENNQSIIEVGDKDTDFNKEIDASSSLININQADINDLIKLNGIGESKAKSIIEYRNTNGLFKNIEEIKNVSGISATIYEKIKDSIAV